MALIRWQPFREIETLRRQFDELFEELAGNNQQSEMTWIPAVELQDRDTNLILRVQLPGMEAKDLDIQVTREAVSIAGEHRYEHKAEDKGFFRSEFRYGKFQRTIPLPVHVQKEGSIVSKPDNKTYELPTGELTVYANEEQNLPSLTNESDIKITLQIQAEGDWNYGDSWIFANPVDANGNPENSGREPYVRFSHIKPAALVALKNDQAVAHGKGQKVELQPGETVSFINNDQQGVYYDNSGTQTVKWSILSAN
ncbi:Hsp20/alpha crystallin family protein [Planktothrix sp. FACHB-1355]|uniref:Hsp20/alpha crystallin family protein n=1 Tax=Aerosakkonema funiforme FACHB-1375 TaxID=2949571 RepID=A0A926VDY6_9CYAN|nr:MULTISPECIES: Hsp20/alpha crystallin family protein [Oscillatoriales]MBD2182095.1 Hsp20/alpha crystallin family protein [Aerosakkonema funiforme FACHB-1375]MBD3559218.1 Hsp20/alpha crystallin family protein [Planktothrix sp. FACHB-1355]